MHFQGKIMKFIFAAALALLAAACSQTDAPRQMFAAKPQTACAQRACTMEYKPVCATIDYNGKQVQHTFGNRCAVCSDIGKVVVVSSGTCSKPLR